MQCSLQPWLFHRQCNTLGIDVFDSNCVQVKLLRSSILHSVHNAVRGIVKDVRRILSATQTLQPTAHVLEFHAPFLNSTHHTCTGTPRFFNTMSTCAFSPAHMRPGINAWCTWLVYPRQSRNVSMNTGEQPEPADKVCQSAIAMAATYNLKCDKIFTIMLLPD